MTDIPSQVIAALPERIRGEIEAVAVGVNAPFAITIMM